MENMKESFEPSKSLKIGSKKETKIMAMVVDIVGRPYRGNDNPIYTLIRETEKMKENERFFSFFAAGKAQGMCEAVVEPMKALMMLEVVKRAAMAKHRKEIEAMLKEEM